MSFFLYVLFTFSCFNSTQDHISDDHDEEREDAKMLLNFCDVQKQLIQTHNSILKLYKEEVESAEEPWKGKSKELVCSLISREYKYDVYMYSISHVLNEQGTGYEHIFSSVQIFITE